MGRQKFWRPLGLGLGLGASGWGLGPRTGAWGLGLGPGAGAWSWAGGCSYKKKNELGGGPKDVFLILRVRVFWISGFPILLTASLCHELGGAIQRELT